MPRFSFTSIDTVTFKFVFFFTFWLGVCESQAQPLSISPFTTLGHGLRSGNVSILNAKQIQINRISYDGRGPAAWFAVGSKGEGYKRPYGDLRRDSDLTFIPDENRSCNRPGLNNAYNGGKNITLTLPGTLNMTDIRFLVMFCIAFNANFGYIEIPQELNISSLPPVGVDFEPVNPCTVTTNGKGEEMFPGGSGTGIGTGPDTRIALPGPMPGPMPGPLPGPMSSPMPGPLPGPMPSPMPSMQPMSPTSSPLGQTTTLSAETNGRAALGASEETAPSMLWTIVVICAVSVIALVAFIVSVVIVRRAYLRIQ